jgi:hypothetical protein
MSNLWLYVSTVDHLFNNRQSVIINNQDQPGVQNCKKMHLETSCTFDEEELIFSDICNEPRK